MNRNDFMRQLEALLQNISPAEREEALQYYNDYFDDAGAENEQEVIEALGNPAKVAENIKKDLEANGYGDNGYLGMSSEDKAMIPYEQEDAGSGYTDTATIANSDWNGNSYTGGKQHDNKLSGGMIAVIVVLCILASPVILGVASGLLGAAVGIVTAWLALIFGFGVAALALLIAFLALAGVGISCLLADPMVGVGLIGGSMLCGGLGILFLMLTVAMAGIATPAIFSSIAGLIKKLFQKKEVNAAC